jgi:hypothetical protein
VTVFSGEGIVIDGPVSRADFVDLLPTVFVDTPAAGAEVGAPLRVTGMARRVRGHLPVPARGRDGTVLAEGFAMTDNGMGWGAFDITLDVDVDADRGDPDRLGVLREGRLGPGRAGHPAGAAPGTATASRDPPRRRR